ncbi:MAG: hypothetical protein AB7R90_09675 [Reyranellaceae bacterium]
MDSGRFGRGGLGALLLAVLALVWAGMVVGVSGLATPVKFAAPSLTLPVALDVGRVTFGLFSQVEWGLALALVVLAALAGLRLLWLAVLVAVVLVVAQATWLLPILDARIAAVIAGNPQPATFHHAAYAVGEAVKLAALLATGIGAMAGGMASRAGRRR